jgi:RNA polymerase sigma-70 factor (ECF subfamily)
VSPSDDVPPEGQPDQEAQPLEPFSERAFEDFHVDTFGPVWQLARRICQDEAEAHDVCQNAYVVVFRYWSAGRLREPPRRLLYRVIQRAAVDVIRSRARRQRLERAVPEPSSVGPWLGVEVRDALRGLRKEDASLLLLQASVGLSYEELAAVTKQSVSAVRSRLYRARRELAERLGRTR